MECATAAISIRGLYRLVLAISFEHFTKRFVAHGAHVVLHMFRFFVTHRRRCARAAHLQSKNIAHHGPISTSPNSTSRASATECAQQQFTASANYTHVTFRLPFTRARARSHALTLDRTHWQKYSHIYMHICTPYVHNYS